jgi:hypothetical protein
MNEFKHSQGPWTYDNDPENPIHRIWSDGKFPIYLARTCYAGQSESNAKLIAEAPALLEMLSDLVRCYKRDGYLTNADLEDAESIINKALNK